MTDLIVFLVTGLAFGSVYALAASGLVLTYSTSGIFNFAHGAFAMLGAFIYWQMTEGWGWPSPIAFLIVLGVVGPFFGAVVERGIMRGLQGTSETTRLMVSVSLLLGSLGLGQVIWETAPRRLPLLFDGAQAFRVAGYNVSWHQVATVIFAAGAAGALWLLLTRSRLGISMRSVVDDRNLARLAGARPDNAAIAAWAIGASMAALAGILTTGGRTLSHFELILLVVNAYAAAMVGRLSSLPRTFAGAVMLGLFDSFIQVYIKAAFPDAAWPESLRGVAAVLLLFGVLLFLRPPELKTLGITRSREIVPDPSYQKVLIGCAAFGAVVFVLGTAVFDISDKTAMAGGIGYGIIMLSLVPLAGYGGQISLAQFAFAGLGAVTMAYFGNGGSIFGRIIFGRIVGRSVLLSRSVLFSCRRIVLNDVFRKDILDRSVHLCRDVAFILSSGVLFHSNLVDSNFFRRAILDRSVLLGSSLALATGQCVVLVEGHGGAAVGGLPLLLAGLFVHNPRTGGPVLTLIVFGGGRGLLGGGGPGRQDAPTGEDLQRVCIDHHAAAPRHAQRQRRLAGRRRPGDQHGPVGREVVKRFQHVARRRSPCGRASGPRLSVRG